MHVQFQALLIVYHVLEREDMRTHVQKKEKKNKSMCIGATTKVVEESGIESLLLANTIHTIQYQTLPLTFPHSQSLFL